MKYEVLFETKRRDVLLRGNDRRAIEMSDSDSVSGEALAAGLKTESGKALAAGEFRHEHEEPAASALPLTNEKCSEPLDPLTLFITLTTYGTWLPGDSRGWRKWKAGQQEPQPLLEDWCRDRMKEEPVLLNGEQRHRVEAVIRKHALLRGWALHAVSVRSNHLHIAVTVRELPKRARDQFKANATRVLRESPLPIENEKIWTKGGDIEIVDTEDDLEKVVLYITEAQDRMDLKQ